MNPQQTPNQLDQALLSYDEISYADFCKRREDFAHTVFDYTLTEFEVRPEFYARHKEALMLKVGEYILKNCVEHINDAEIKAEWSAQRAIVTIQMLQQLADEQRKEKGV